MEKKVHTFDSFSYEVGQLSNENDCKKDIYFNIMIHQCDHLQSIPLVKLRNDFSSFSVFIILLKDFD